MLWAGGRGGGDRVPQGQVPVCPSPQTLDLPALPDLHSFPGEWVPIPPRHTHGACTGTAACTLHQPTQLGPPWADGAAGRSQPPPLPPTSCGYFILGMMRPMLSSPVPTAMLPGQLEALPGNPGLWGASGWGMGLQSGLRLSSAWPGHPRGSPPLGTSILGWPTDLPGLEAVPLGCVQPRQVGTAACPGGSLPEGLCCVPETLLCPGMNQVCRTHISPSPTAARAEPGAWTHTWFPRGW